jgi:ArsR family transcriptional regulator
MQALMEELLAALTAAADPTRLRLLALAGIGAFCVSDFCEILGQSQPRLSRHLKLLCDAGFLARAKEGTQVWFTLAQNAKIALAREVLAQMPADDTALEADRRGAARVLAERARAATAQFTAAGADWDEMRALGLPAARVEERLLARLCPHGEALGRMLDIGTGTGRMLEVFAPNIAAGLGVDASRAMLALARVRLAQPAFSQIAVNLADMYALPLPAQSFDLVMLHMVLHFAVNPAQVLAEAARVLAPNGKLVIVDLAAHGDTLLAEKYFHRHLGFADNTIDGLLAAQNLRLHQSDHIDAVFPIKIWCAEHIIFPAKVLA